MRTRVFFALVGLLSLGAGTALWFATRPPPPDVATDIAPVALYAATFRDLGGRTQALGQFQGRVLVLNFWATWCAPCLEEMPAFERLHQRWRDRGVQFVGLSAEEPQLAAKFGERLGISYPLWTGGPEVAELSKRLGNRHAVLPHTALLGANGRILAAKVGPYTEAELDGLLQIHAAKSR